jgi:hypothetical protein
MQVADFENARKAAFVDQSIISLKHRPNQCCQAAYQCQPSEDILKKTIQKTMF